MNKLMTGAYESYKRSTIDSIYKAYKKPSVLKTRAWYYCERLCDELNGRNLKVVGKNCNFFSAGFEYPNPKTGVAMFMYITHTKDRTAEIPV